MKTPRILITAAASGSSSYIDALVAAGAKPTAVYCPDVDLSYDGLVLSGGEDIDPKHYGEEVDGSAPPNAPRDESELAIARAYVEAGKPVLGICRGHQLLNVVLGGTLIQDLGDDLRPFHANWAAFDSLSHQVKSAPDSLMHTLYGDVFRTNSSHHQATKALGNGLKATLWSESGIIEAAEHESKPFFSVQFHPERMTGRFARPDTVDGAAIFERFVALCRGE